MELLTKKINLSIISKSLCVRCHSYVDNGGASQDRTDDPLLAKQVLSQLSYGPK